MWIFWWPGNWNLAEGRASITSPCSAAWYGWTLWLGHHALGLSKGTVHTYLEPRLGTACQSWMSTGKGCLQGPLGQLIQATGSYTTLPRRLLFAAIAHQAPRGKRARCAELAARSTPIFKGTYYLPLSRKRPWAHLMLPATEDKLQKSEKKNEVFRG